MLRRVKYVIASLTVVSALVLASCGKEEKPVPQSVQAPAPTVGDGWRPTLPPELAGLQVKDGGSCYLDAINGAAIESSPTRIKAGSPMSFGGWAAVDVKAGVAGSSLGVQLNAATPYFISAETYQRQGLGAALKSSSTLDAGGLRLNATPLNVPAGNYRVLYLIQSGGDLLRCDTGRNILVE